MNEPTGPGYLITTKLRKSFNNQKFLAYLFYEPFLLILYLFW